MIYLGDKPVGVAVGGKSASGTFTGDGTKTQEIDIGFEPDVIVVDSDLDVSEAGWTGNKSIVIARKVLSSNCLHTSATATSGNVQGMPLSPEDPWGENISTAYKTTASYSNGILTISNVSAMYFVSGAQYSWAAYRK